MSSIDAFASSPETNIWNILISNYYPGRGASNQILPNTRAEEFNKKITGKECKIQQLFEVWSIFCSKFGTILKMFGSNNLLDVSHYIFLQNL